MSFRLKALFVVFALTLPAVRADEKFRPSDPKEFADPSKNTMVRLKNARVSYVNVPALERDFPRVAAEIKAGRIPSWESWVVENYAYISRGQLALDGIRHSNLAVDASQTKEEIRPAGYGRAGVQVGPDGLVDLKGTGLREKDPRLTEQKDAYAKAKGNQGKIDELRNKDHSDGLLSHGEAIAELTRQQRIQRAFDAYNAEHGTDFQTVENYFILELDVDIYRGGGKKMRAAILGRQAHIDRQAPPDGLPKVYEDAAPQATRSGALVDFGNAHVLLDAFKMEGKFDAQKSNVWKYAHEVADAFARTENPDPDAVYRHLREMLGPSDAAHRQSRKSREAVHEAIAEARVKHGAKTPFGAVLAAYLTQGNPQVVKQLAHGLDEFYRRNYMDLANSLEGLEKLYQASSSAEYKARLSGMIVRFLSQDAESYMDPHGRVLEAIAKRIAEGDTKIRELYRTPELLNQMRRLEWHHLNSNPDTESFSRVSRDRAIASVTAILDVLDPVVETVPEPTAKDKPPKRNFFTACLRAMRTLMFLGQP